MKSQHINPEEAVDLMIAVKANAAMAIHWGTFPLTPEPVMEPRERLAQAVEDAEIDIDSFVACSIAAPSRRYCCKNLSRGGEGPKSVQKNKGPTNITG